MAILKADSIKNINGVTVNEYLLTKHNSKNIAMPSAQIPNVIGITIHNTDWISVSSDTTPAEQYTRATVNDNMGDVRVHFYVDNKCAWQNLPLSLSGWHAADGNGDGNRKTIAIECIMSSAYNDIDKKSEDNAAKLAAGLLKQYGFGIDQLFTHQHWYSRKYCPAYILPHWESFRRKVQGYLSESTSTGSSDTSSSAELYRIRKSWTDSSSQIGAYSSIDNAINAWREGFIIYNSKGEQVYPEATEASTNEFPPTLKKGDDNQYVETLQLILIGKGFSCGTYGADHNFGSATETAVMNFQTQAKISATGVCDMKTWKELFKY